MAYLSLVRFYDHQIPRTCFMGIITLHVHTFNDLFYVLLIQYNRYTTYLYMISTYGDCHYGDCT